MLATSITQSKLCVQTWWNSLIPVFSRWTHQWRGSVTLCPIYSEKYCRRTHHAVWLAGLPATYWHLPFPRSSHTVKQSDWQTLEPLGTWIQMKPSHFLYLRLFSFPFFFLLASSFSSPSTRSLVIIWSPLRPKRCALGRSAAQRESHGRVVVGM